MQDHAATDAALCEHSRGQPSAAWREAEQRLGLALARAVETLTRLDERLRHAPDACRQRLRLQDVADLSWHLGDRVPLDRLSLYLVTRLTGASDDAQALSRAAWAVRRLEHGVPPDPGDSAALARFLGRGRVDAAVAPMVDHPLGGEFDALVGQLSHCMADVAGCHRLTRAAALWDAWGALGLSGVGPGLIEGAVVASRLGVGSDRSGGLHGLPLGLAGASILRPSGDPHNRLAVWYDALHQAALQALLDVDRMTAWRRRSLDAVARYSGRTPARLIEVLARWPLASASLLANESDASLAAVQRNMARLRDSGLVREVTGQQRFRFWAAQI